MGELDNFQVEYAKFIEKYKPSDGNTIHALLYGESGAGKTHLAGTFPNCVWIDTDQGMKTLGTEQNRIRLSEVDKPFETVMSLLRDAKRLTGPFAKGQPWFGTKSLIIDSMTALCDDFILPQIMENQKKSMATVKPGYDEYGMLQGRMGAISRAIKSLEDYNVVVTAIAYEEKNELTGDIEGKPLMTGKYRDKIQADYDEVYYLQAVVEGVGQNAKRKYQMYARPQKYYIGKSRLLTIDFLDDPSYDKLVRSLKNVKKV